MYLKILFSLSIIALIGCRDSNPVNLADKPEFVLTNINVVVEVLSLNDSIVSTKAGYELRGYFRGAYGRIIKQIITIEAFTDSTIVSNVPENPFQIIQPNTSTQFELPNILNNKDSATVYVKIFGVYFKDSTKSQLSDSFCLQESLKVKVFHIVMPANQSLNLTW